MLTQAAIQSEPGGLITSPVTPSDLAWMVSKGKWYPADHLLLLDEALVKVSLGLIKRLMIFMPPRHGKSELTSKYFPAWYLGRNPDKRVILTSYEADFAASWGYKVRTILQDYGNPCFGINLSQKSAAKNRWDILGHNGGMITAGVGGAITGKGADLLIIDDPVKNAEEAQSETYRQKTYDWYISTAFTRLEPGGAVILIQTRWHEDDLAGRILANEGDKWTVISLPALAEKDDLLGRKEGEALFTSRYSRDNILEIKKTLGSYWFSALYQQRPQPAGGAVFKREYFKYATLENGIIDLGEFKKYVFKDCKIFQTCDPATSTKETADYFVLSTWAQTPINDLVLLNVHRTRLESPDQVNLFKQGYTRWKPVQQWVEQNGIGKTLYQSLLRTGLPVKKLDADTDKVTRALPTAARMEAGTVYFLRDEDEGQSWLHDFEEELLRFPNGAHDDQVDTLSYAGQVVIESINGFDDLDLSKLICAKKRH